MIQEPRNDQNGNKSPKGYTKFEKWVIAACFFLMIIPIVLGLVFDNSLRSEISNALQQELLGFGIFIQIFGTLAIILFCQYVRFMAKYTKIPSIKYDHMSPVLMLIMVAYICTFFALNLAHGNLNSGSTVAIAFQLGGAISNCFEQLKYGEVTNYIEFWPGISANAADLMIVFGFLMMLTFH